MKASPAKILDAAAATFRERNALYGDNYKQGGQQLAALFPQGLMLTTPSDFARFSLFMFISAKLSRYAVNFNKGGHQDSIHDIMVYAAMLEALDADLCS